MSAVSVKKNTCPLFELPSGYSEEIKISKKRNRIKKTGKEKEKNILRFSEIGREKVNVLLCYFEEIPDDTADE